MCRNVSTYAERVAGILGCGQRREHVLKAKKEPLVRDGGEAFQDRWGSEWTLWTPDSSRESGGLQTSVWKKHIFIFTKL